MILKNCRLVPELCEGFQTDFADIRIEGDLIAEILPAGGSYTGEEVIDCDGKTVLPGLHNLHIHLWFFTIVHDRLYAAHNEMDDTFHSIHYMNNLLVHGYTSLRDVGGPYQIGIRLRDAVNSGMMIGPRIKSSGYILTPDQYCALDLHCHSDKYGWAINSPEQARDITRKQLVAGADYIKILGSSATGLDRDDSSLFYPDELDAIDEVVRREKTYLAVHTNTKESLMTALERENWSIEHGNFMDQECIDTFVKHDFKSQLVATVHVSHIFGGDDLVMMSNGKFKDAADAGVLIGWGTDAMEDLFLMEPGVEFRLRHDLLGFSNIDILKQATINSAIINKDGDTLGTIKVGKKADFAIFDGKPDEDLTVFNKPCAYVIKGGELVAENGRIRVF